MSMQWLIRLNQPQRHRSWTLSKLPLPLLHLLQMVSLFDHLFQIIVFVVSAGNISEKMGLVLLFLFLNCDREIAVSFSLSADIDQRLNGAW